MDGNIEPIDMVRLMSIPPDVCECEATTDSSSVRDSLRDEFPVMAVEKVEGLHHAVRPA